MATYSNRFLALLLTLATLCGLSGCTYDLVVRAGYSNPAGVYSAVEGPPAAGYSDAGAPVATPDGGRKLGANANYAYAVGFGANSVPWAATYATPTITQTAPTSDVATVPLTITSQAPWASAVTNIAPGNIVLNTPAPVGAGATGFVNIQGGGANKIQMGQLVGSPTYSALYLVPGVTPSASNFTLVTNSSGPILAGPTSVQFQASGGTAMLLTGSAATLGVPTITWNSALVPNIQQQALASTSAGSGAAGQTMSVTAQAGQAATGSGNNGGAGATLSLSGGVGGTSGSATAGKGGAVAIGSSMLLHETTLNASTYTVDTNSTTGDLIILDKYPSTGASAVTLPAVVAGRVVIIIDASGAAATHNITVTPASGTCNGSATCVISTNYASDRLVSDGTNWFTFYAVEGTPEDWAAWADDAANDNAWRKAAGE